MAGCGRDEAVDDDFVEMLMSHQCDDRIAIYVPHGNLGIDWWPFPMADRHSGFSFDRVKLVLKFDHNGLSRTIAGGNVDRRDVPVRDFTEFVLDRLARKKACMVTVRLNHYLDGSEYVTNVLIESVDASGETFFCTKINCGNSRCRVPMAASDLCARLDEEPGGHVWVTTFSMDESLLPKDRGPQRLISSLGFAMIADGLRLDGSAVVGLHRNTGLAEMRDIFGDQPEALLDEDAPSKRSFVLLGNRLGFKIKTMARFCAAALALRGLPKLERELARLSQSIFPLWKDAGLFYKAGDFARFDGYRRNFSQFVSQFDDFQKAQSDAVLELLKI